MLPQLIAMFLAVAPQVENQSRDPNAVGDLARTGRPSIGLYQIRAEYLADVNKHYRQQVLKTYGRKLTLRDMKDPKKAKWVATRYLTWYGHHYTRTTGRQPTLQVVARIHNGGEHGWKRAATLAYWTKVKAATRRV